MSGYNPSPIEPLVNSFGMLNAHSSLDYAVSRLEDKWAKLETQMVNLGVLSNTDMAHPDLPATSSSSDLGKVYELLYCRIISVSVQMEALQARLDL